MSPKDKIAMLCCYLIVCAPLAAMVWACVAPDKQVNHVLALVDGPQK